MNQMCIYIAFRYLSKQKKSIYVLVFFIHLLLESIESRIYMLISPNPRLSENWSSFPLMLAPQLFRSSKLII
jgi:hypothetical protein